MASSIDQQWRLHHQTRSIMDSSTNSNVQFSTNGQFNPESIPTTLDQPVNQSSFQVTPYYHINVNHPSINYGPHSTVYSSNQLTATGLSNNVAGGGQSGPSEFVSTDYYSGECVNSQPINVYDYSARTNSSTLNTPTLENINPFEACQYNNQSSAILFSQSANTPTTTQYYSTIAATQEPYYLPAITYTQAATTADNYQQSQDQHHRPPMYADSYELADPLSVTNREGATHETNQAPTARVFATSSSSVSMSSLSATGGANDQPSCPNRSAMAIAATGAGGCCSSSSTTAAAKFVIPATSKQQAAFTTTDATNSAESSALLDSTSNQPLSSERRIKPKQPSSGNQQQSDQLISSCHSNRVRAGPLGIIARRKNATRETTAILKEWLDEHGHNPYPSKGEKIMLSCVTKMSMTQVSTWFANARRRIKKEKRSYWSSGAGGGGLCGGGAGRSSGPGGGHLSRSRAPSSLTKVKSEYAKVVLASTTGCPALKYFMQKHHRQMLAEAEHTPVEKKPPTSLTTMMVSKEDPQPSAASAAAAAPSGQQYPALTAPAFEPPLGHAHPVSDPNKRVKIERDTLSDVDSAQPSRSSSSASCRSSSSSSSKCSSSSSQASPNQFSEGLATSRPL